LGIPLGNRPEFGSKRLFSKLNVFVYCGPQFGGESLHVLSIFRTNRLSAEISDCFFECSAHTSSHDTIPKLRYYIAVEFASPSRTWTT
jgi:hypothetical protein